MPDVGFICGYVIEVIGPHAVEFAERLLAGRGLWGAALRREMLDYNYFSGLGMVGECMPQRINEVKPHATERDRHGLPVAHVLFGYHENDRRLIAHAKEKIEDIFKAAGGSDIWDASRTAHLMGTCRMGHDSHDSVVNADCRAHDVPNLFICDGSVF